MGLIRATTIVLACLTVCPVIADDLNTPEGFTPLFNGKNLDGWYGRKTANPTTWDQASEADLETWAKDVEAHWSVKDGAIVNDGFGVFLTTEKSFSDMELLIEYKTVPKADSGIYLRGTPQVQIWDSTNEKQFRLGADKGSGGLWNNSPGAAGKDPLALADKPFGEWNKFRILQVGARTTVWLNDKLVVDNATMENYWARKLPLIRSGAIQLQTHGGEIQWRNIFVREIGAEEVNKWLREKDSNGSEFTSLFNGKNLDGWKGALENYEVVDEAIQCKEGHGGVLHTPEEYADFEVLVEFQLPPGGNNGLAIRYPGKGDTAYVGMCELQVLDNTAKKFANLDKRQYHGSAYGMIAAHRGYLRETGQWNYQRVRVEGSRIIVELNGTIILDGDLSTVSEYMAGRPHPGKDNAKGYFGFAGHNDPVRFRNVFIREL
jgi:hypothetical protein